ncbi:MAG TPA: glutamate synthase central domain-containing protein, partial [Actinomycetes bacterium]
VYKGMLTPDQLQPFFLDLSDPRFASALALVHSRFSTNTFPSWPLAHPYRFIAHNGEINTVMGNRNWMRAREATLATAHIPGRLADLFPVLTPGASDSASFDEALELLTLGGYELPHAVLMMIPEAWENDARMDRTRRAFYAYHAGLMEAWDGPASITFTDGSLVGAVLDRNGLRPGRFWVTDDGLVVLASEAGVLDIEPSRVVRKGRLQPGRMFLVDLDAGRIIEDDEIKARLAAAHPYQAWLDANLTTPPHEGHLHPIGRGEGHIHTPRDRGNGAPTRPGQQSKPPPTQEVAKFRSALLHQQRLFGYTEEELRVLVAPMARDGAEPIGSMGTDTPLAVLSERPRLLFDYFTQLFAQVTNPPLDAIREELVTSLQVRLGPQDNLLAPGPDACRQIVLPYPVLDHADLAALQQLRGFPAATITATYPVAGGGASLRERLTEVCAQASAAIGTGAAVLVLSDRRADADHAPVPSLLLTGAVHHHLVREKTRTRVGLVVEAGDAREVHHIALLLGYGANAVHPYVALDSAAELGRWTGGESTAARRNLVKAYAKGVLKVMSKMGVSTVASYTGAQIFEALGLGEDLVQAYFTGTTSRLGGIGLDEIAEEVRCRHQRAYGRPPPHRRLEVGGEYQWRREGEPHLFDPETVFRLQHATRTRQYEIFKQYTQRVDEQSARLMTLRGLFRLRNGLRPPVPIDEVEPVSEIVKRFNTGAMSYGSISLEAHQTLAIAMNRLG